MKKSLLIIIGFAISLIAFSQPKAMYDSAGWEYHRERIDSNFLSLYNQILALESSGTQSSDTIGIISIVIGDSVNAPIADSDSLTNPAFYGNIIKVYRSNGTGVLGLDYNTSVEGSTLYTNKPWSTGDTVEIYIYKPSTFETIALVDTATAPSGEAIAHYPFEQTLDDNLGNYDGTVITSITYENTISTLDNYYITIDAARGMTLPQINFGDAFSISGWCQIGVSAGEKCIMDALESNDGFEIGWILGVDPSTNPDSLYIITGNGVTTDTLFSTNDNSFAQGNTYHFVYTMDRTLGEGKIYVDAVDITGNGDILSDFETNVTSYIGRTADNSKWWLKQMDDLQFYNYVVDQTDVTWLYNNIGNRLE